MRDAIAPSAAVRWGRPRGSSFWAVAVAMPMLAVAIPAGGLGVAPILGLTGAVALVGFLVSMAGSGAWRSLRPPPLWAGLLAAFFIWALVSWSWSSYDSFQRAGKLALSVPLYACFVMACANLSGLALQRTQLLFVLVVLAASALFLFEMLTGGAITRAGGRMDRPQGEIWRNLGHGVSVMVAVAPAFLVVLWSKGAMARGVAIGACVVLAAGSLVFGLSANALGVAAAGLAMLAAVRRPRLVVAAAGTAAAASILFAPLFALAKRVSAVWTELLPLSWRQREEIWAVTAQLILEKPLFGHGFDAARTRHDYMVLDGVRFDLMPLHPHNAGLHVWYETGIIGACLLSAALAAAAWRTALAPGLGPAQAVAVAGAWGGIAAMAAVSYGVWQEWWIATAFLAAAACLLTGDGDAREG